METAFLCLLEQVTSLLQLLQVIATLGIPLVIFTVIFTLCTYREMY